jgi:hypothetical protein
VRGLARETFVWFRRNPGASGAAVIIAVIVGLLLLYVSGALPGLEGGDSDVSGLPAVAVEAKVKRPGYPWQLR